jgi:hypothetical protein
VTTEIFLPIHIVSEANKRGHWAKGHTRAQSQRDAVALVGGMFPPLEQARVVTMVRVYGSRARPMDEGDNLPRAFKAVRDQVARTLKVDDSARGGVVWLYTQRRTVNPAEVGVVLRFQPITSVVSAVCGVYGIDEPERVTPWDR